MNLKQTLLLLVCLMTTCMTAKAADADTIDVRNCNELVNAMKANRNIRLKADIDLTNFKESIEEFKGSIYGLYFKDGVPYSYKLKNCKQILALKMTGATVIHVTLEDCEPEWRGFFGGDWKGNAVLCREAENSSFIDVDVVNGVVAYDCWIQQAVFPTICRGAALVASATKSTFQYIHIENCQIYVRSDLAGGVVAESDECTFSKITVDQNTFVHAQGYGILTSGDAGGVVGKAKNTKFTDCENQAYVSSPMDNVGGIAGYATQSCLFDHCTNLGVLTHLDIDRYKYLKSLASNLSQLGAGLAYTNDLAIQYNAEYLQYHDSWNKWFRVKHKYTSELDKLKKWNPTTREYEFPQGREKFVETEKNHFEWEQSNPEPQQPNASKAGKYAWTVFQVFLFAVDIAQKIYEAQDPDNIGGIVGSMEDGGSIVACINYGVVRAMDAYSGGIAGEAEGNGLVIEHCLNAGAVTGYEQTGGIVGMIRNGALRYCINTGNIGKAGRSTEGTFGRIYGEKENGVTVSNNNFSGNITEEESNGQRMVSQQLLSSGELGLSLNTSSGTTYWRQTVGKDAFPVPSMKSDSIYAAKINTELDGVYHVATAEDLIPALTNQYANVVLDADINVGGANIFNLSSQYMPFYGTIDGQGHKISNVRYNIQQKKNKTFGNDNRERWTAIFPVAENATFKNLTLENVILDYTNGEAIEAALLVSHSKNCRYENVHLTGNSGVIEADGGGSYFAWKIGGIVSYSENDTFTDCSTGKDCTITATGTKTEEDANVGGLVSNAANSTFTRCYNAANVEVHHVQYLGVDVQLNDVAGGILGWDVGGSKFTGCMNIGTVSGDEYIGGLVGKGTDTSFRDCMNLGTITGDNETAVGGLAGYVKGNKAMDRCFSFGDINGTKSDNNNGIYIGEVDGSYTLDNASKYKCNKGSNVTDEEAASFASGQYTYDMNFALAERTWYQAIDDNYSFPTKYFVPIPAAGQVHINYLCDADETSNRTQIYSNKYQAIQSHDRSLNSMGVCTKCGYAAAAPTACTVVDIATTTELIDFAALVSSKSDYSAISARLTADIDLNGCNFPTIGSKTFPYKGEFDGQGHRIKNMKLTATDGAPCGFFSAIGNGAEISNVVIDSTCVITGQGSDVAGVVGVAWGNDVNSEFKVTITGCGNEANVTGNESVAGILGRIDNSNVGRVEIKNCYNTGTITSLYNPSAICAWIYNNFSIENCYNSGVVTGTDGKLFYHSQDGGNHTVTNCYDVNGEQDGVAQVTAAQVASGEVCYKLNGSDDNDLTKNGYYQRVDIEGTHPCFTVNTDDVVSKATLTYCDNTTEFVYCNVQRNPVDQITERHRYDDNGFCTATEGETHYQEPEKIGNIYQLKNAGNLYWVAKQVNNGWEYPNCCLVSDIVVNENLVAQTTGTCEGLRRWTPIGTETYPYQNATFDGNGHTISGLFYKDDVGAGVGLFGFAYNGAVIANLGVIDSYFDVANGSGIGAIVGWGGQSYSKPNTKLDGNGPTLINCYSDGKVWGDNYVGGLMGFAAVSTTTGNNVADKINTCYSTAHVVGAENYTGALFGYLELQDGNSYSGTLPYCYSCSGKASAMTAGNTSDGTLSCYETPMTEADFSNGKVCDNLNHSEYISDVHWAQDIAVDAKPYFGNEGVALTRQIDKQWGTVVLPYDVYSDSDVAYFVISGISHDEGSEDATITLKHMTKVGANTPCIFCTSNPDTTAVTFRSGGRELTIPLETTVTSTPVEGLSMVGTYLQAEIANGYINSDSAFWSKSVLEADARILIKPYFAYLNAGTALDGVKRIYFNFVGSNFDFNEDGVFNTGDVSFLSGILSGRTQSAYIYDVTGDRRLTILDVSTLIKELNTPGSTIAPKPVITAPTANNGVIYGK